MIVNDIDVSINNIYTKLVCKNRSGKVKKPVALGIAQKFVIF